MTKSGPDSTYGPDGAATGRSALIRQALKRIAPRRSDAYLEGGSRRDGSVQGYNPLTSYMASPRMHEMLVRELAETAHAFSSRYLPSICADSVDGQATAVRDFFRVYARCPVAPDGGSSGFHNVFWLYTLARWLQPKFVVESGIWKGQTCWLFKQVSPQAHVIGFDITLGNLEHRCEGVEYVEADWSTWEFGEIDPESSLCFFDCHVNHARRVREAYERGFRHLVFDDNPPAHKLYAYGAPGVPTIEMLMSDPLHDDEIVWFWRGEERQYRPAEDDYAARELIERTALFPDVGGSTRYGGYSFLTYVRLKT